MAASRLATGPIDPSPAGTAAGFSACMGLDITAYKGAVIIVNGEPMPSDDGDPLVPYRNPDFPYQFEGLYERKYSAHDSFAFCAGSYGGYGEWRRRLASLVGIGDLDAWWSTNSGRGDPFAELIMFSDCEGSIGPVVCEKLAKDFERFNVAAAQMDSDCHGSYFLQRYDDWRKAFEFGSTGWVDFH